MPVSFLDEMELLDNLIIQDSSDDDEKTAEESPNLSSQPNKLIGLAVAFCLTFRVVHNIPDGAITTSFQTYIFSNRENVSN